MCFNSVVNIVCSDQYWTSSNIRNGQISTSCTSGTDNQALVFGEGIRGGYLVSHSALTNNISLSNITGSGTSDTACCQSVYPSSPTCTSSLSFAITPTHSLNTEHTESTSIADNNSTTENVTTLNMSTATEVTNITSTADNNLSTEEILMQEMSTTITSATDVSSNTSQEKKLLYLQQRRINEVSNNHVFLDFNSCKPAYNGKYK